MDIHTDRQALVALYEATDGPNWSRNDNWCTDAPLGEWHGVTVDRSGRVAELDLRDNWLLRRSTHGKSNLVRVTTVKRMCGPIPVELAWLANLRKLDLSGNTLTGPIPAELARLANLTKLDLGYNMLTGPIPVELARLANLEKLDLEGNMLTGPIPVELAQLTNLKSLTIDSNDLTGTIPAELGQLANLQTLIIHNNELTGPIPQSSHSSPT